MPDNPNEQDKKHGPPSKKKTDEKPVTNVVGGRINGSVDLRKDEKKRERKN